MVAGDWRCSRSAVRALSGVEDCGPGLETTRRYQFWRTPYAAAPPNASANVTRLPAAENKLTEALCPDGGEGLGQLGFRARRAG